MSKRFNILILILSSLSLIACGGGSSSSSNPQVTPPDNNPVNVAPVISGSPSQSVVSGNNYSFTPTATDSDGDNLTFSASNLPAWASFNTNTGTISGTPTDNDQGTYNNIVITVSDGQETDSLSGFSIAVTVTTNPNGSISLSWSAPTNYSDGSNLSLSDIGGYRVYMGTTTGNMALIADLSGSSSTQYTINNLASGNYYIAIAVYDNNNVEGNNSSVVNVVI